MSMLHHSDDPSGDDSIPRCPHCSKPLVTLRFGAPFGPLAVKIIDAVVAAGATGISLQELFAVAYGDRKNASLTKLASYIRTINSRLSSRDLAIRKASTGQFRITPARRM